MSLSALRIGKSQITLDWSASVSVDRSKLQGPGPADLEKAWAKLTSRFQSGEVGFFHAPTKDEISQARASFQLAEKFRQDRQFNDCLFLGIGGSALGPIAALDALQERMPKNALRFHFIENVDPVEWKSTITKLDPASTLVCVVTKSGTTFETLSQFMIAMEWLGRSRLKTHVVAITDPEKGDLRAFVAQEGIQTLSIHPSIGGRFSILSPVGLFPMALAGLDISMFLQGAQEVAQAFESPWEKNAIAALACEVLRHKDKRPIHVCMPYSSRMRKLGAFFVQLWAESLGKDGKGFTPLAALGATDQHSILQLLRDGPDDKMTWFFHIDQVADAVSVPRAPLKNGPGGFAAFQILENNTLHDLLRIEYESTLKVLIRRERPVVRFHLNSLDERSFGALVFAMCALTAMTGTLWDLNPFDQPGVEEAKIYIREALNERKRQNH